MDTFNLKCRLNGTISLKFNYSSYYFIKFQIVSSTPSTTLHLLKKTEVCSPVPLSPAGGDFWQVYWKVFVSHKSLWTTINSFFLFSESLLWPGKDLVLFKIKIRFQILSPRCKRTYMIFFFPLKNNHRCLKYLLVPV